MEIKKSGEMKQLTNEEKAALIARGREIHAEYSRPNHSKAFSVIYTEIAELARISLSALEAPEPVYQFVDNKPEDDGYAQWADCNPDFYSTISQSERRTLYTAPPAPVAPAGWQLVPVEPTEEMLIAYYDKSIAPIGRLSLIGYRAMLAAAPDITDSETK